MRFEITFQAYIGGGEMQCTYDSARGGRICGGEGLSLSYGLLPSEGVGQAGGGGGLRLVFDTGPRHGPSIAITYDNVLLLRHSLAPSGGWVRGEWVALRVGYGTYDSPAGLIIERNGQADVRDFLLPGWSPEATWQLALAASTGLAVDEHLVDNLTISTDALIAPLSTQVEVTLNGQQYTRSGRAIVYDAPIVISAFSPTSGPIQGLTRVTVYGYMLDHGLAYSCRFGNATVHAHYNQSTGDVVCPASPARPSGDLPFAISLDGSNWVDAPSNFTFYPGLAAAIVPTGGPLGGGTSVLVQGAGLGTGSDYRCRYGGKPAVGGITMLAGPFPPNPTTVHCTVPPLPHSGSTELQISLNGQQYSSPLPYLVHTPPTIVQLSPSSGPALGGTRVNVSGASLTMFETQICQFGPQPREFQTSMRLASTTAAHGATDALRLCVSRSVEAAMLGAAFDVKEEMGLGNATLMGEAYGLAGVAAVLNPPRLTTTGSLLVPAPPLAERALPYFSVSFRIGGKNSLRGEGFSFSYASHLWSAVGVDGAMGSGLAVSFRIWPSCELRVHLDGASLYTRSHDTEDGAEEDYEEDHTRSTGCWLDAAGFADVTVAFTTTGLHVHSDALGSVLGAFPLHGWAPRAGWVTAFGASSGLLPASFQLVNAHLSFGAHVTPHLASIEIAQNGQQFTSDGVNFTY